MLYFFHHASLLVETFHALELNIEMAHCGDPGTCPTWVDHISEDIIHKHTSNSRVLWTSLNGAELPKYNCAILHMKRSVTCAIPLQVLLRDGLMIYHVKSRQAEMYGGPHRTFGQMHIYIYDIYHELRIPFIVLVNCRGVTIYSTTKMQQYV